MALVTRDGVFAICERIKAADDREPTLEELRRDLGGGSDRDISRYRDEWREANNRKVELAHKPPPEVERAMVDAGRRIWTEAQRLANAVLAAANEESEAKLSRLQSDNAELLASSTTKDELIADLTQQLDAAKSATRAAEAETERHRGALQKQEQVAALQDDVIKHLRADVALLRARVPVQRKHQGKA